MMLTGSAKACSLAKPSEPSELTAQAAGGYGSSAPSSLAEESRDRVKLHPQVLQDLNSVLEVTLRWFGACPRRPASRGHTLISCTVVVAQPVRVASDGVRCRLPTGC
ncbi:MAG TPA: hypothetical protein VIK22_01355 [Candidatus Anoxymicrobiaceae bacterium]